MLYYDDSEYKNRGIDYDLYACLIENKQEDFNVNDIEKVLAVYEGYNEGDSWHWVLELKTNTFVYLTGWCDYTGWDCQSDAWSIMCPSDVAAAHMATVIEQDEDHPGHEVYSWNNDNIDMSAYLLNQLNTKKLITWREEMDEEFGL